VHCVEPLTKIGSCFLKDGVLEHREMVLTLGALEQLVVILTMIDLLGAAVTHHDRIPLGVEEIHPCFPAVCCDRNTSV